MTGPPPGLFDPDRVAVVGATDRPGSVGRALVENLLATFTGEVVPVNPNHDRLFDRDCPPDLAGAGEIDLAVVAVPAPAVAGVLRDAAAAGVEAAVVVSAGFAETGPEGAERERELAAVAAETDLTVIGPNCVGIVSTSCGLNATFAPVGADPGPVSFVSQSGAFVTAVLDWAADRDLGFRRVVSLGNEAVVDEVDLLGWLGADPGTDVVLAYLEDVVDGRAFVETARAVTPETPVVALKSGRTEAGARAVASHTGSIAGSEAAADAATTAAGVLRARTAGELFDYGQALAGQSPPPTDAVAVVTNAGGPGVMATDAVGDSRLSLADLGEPTRERLRAVLPPAGRPANPVDVVGDADLDRFGAALDAVLGDDAVGAGIVIAAPTALFEPRDLAEVVLDTRRRHATPVVTCLMGGDRAVAAARRLDDEGVPNYFDPARAVRSLAALAEYREIAGREPDPPATFDDTDRERARAVLATAGDRPGGRLGVEATPLLDAYGIPTPAAEVVDGPDAARAAAERLGGPVVMKLVSPDVIHKSDVGGVELGVEPADAPAVYERLLGRARAAADDPEVLGVQVVETVPTDDGVETLVGLSRDPQFGPLVAFGLGGVHVEVLDDVAVRLAPPGRRTAREMTAAIRAAPLLRGARGRPAVDLDAVVDAICRLGRLAADFPAIRELDVNPLLATPDGVCALDLRLTVDRDGDG
jgi:acetyltransferase